jgi:hypothetical protein
VTTQDLIARHGSALSKIIAASLTAVLSTKLTAKASDGGNCSSAAVRRSHTRRILRAPRTTAFDPTTYVLKYLCKIKMV